MITPNAALMTGYSAFHVLFSKHGPSSCLYEYLADRSRDKETGSVDLRGSGVALSAQTGCLDAAQNKRRRKGFCFGLQPCVGSPARLRASQHMQNANSDMF